MKNIINLKVQDAENIIFEGEVDRISSFNDVGKFDVFPMHANFISIIRQELSFYHKNEKLKELKIEQAILKAKKDIVHIFLGIETLVIDDEGTEDAKNKIPQKK